MNATTYAIQAKQQIAYQVKERTIIKAYLTKVANQIASSQTTSSGSQSFAISSKAFRDSFQKHTGFTGDLSPAMLQTIIDDVIDEMDGAVDDNGFPSETTLVLTPVGRLLAFIVRTVCIQYGKAYCHHYLQACGGKSALANDEHLATSFAIQLVSPDTTQQGVSRTILQYTIERQLSGNQIIKYIQNSIKSRCKNYFIKVANQTEFCSFNQVITADDASDNDEGTGFQIEDPLDLAQAICDKDTEKHCVSKLQDALSDLPDDLKPIMRMWFDNIQSPELTSKRTFHGQIETIGAQVGISRRVARRAAKSIVAHMQQTLGVRTVSTVVKAAVPKSAATKSRLKKKSVDGNQVAAAEFVFTELSEEKVVTDLRLENEDTMKEYGHGGFSVGPVLSFDRTAGKGVSSAVLSSDIEDLDSLLFRRNFLIELTKIS